jgi:hypothetical protein
MIEQIPDHVAAGVALLNQLDPEWPLKIDLSRFDVKNHFQCVLGQLYGGYTKGLYAIFTNCSPHVAEKELAVRNGFNVSCSDGVESIYTQQPVLNREWVRVITEMKAARGR